MRQDFQRLKKTVAASSVATITPSESEGEGEGEEEGPAGHKALTSDN